MLQPSFFEEESWWTLSAIVFSTVVKSVPLFRGTSASLAVEQTSRAHPPSIPGPFWAILKITSGRNSPFYLHFMHEATEV